MASGLEPDTRIFVLATVDNNVDAEDKACAHFGAQMCSPVEWGRCEHPRDQSIHSSWDNDDDDRQIWLESTAGLPPGDEPASWYSVIGMRNVKHPFVRPNQGVAADNAALDAFFKAIPGTANTCGVVSAKEPEHSHLHPLTRLGRSTLVHIVAREEHFRVASLQAGLSPPISFRKKK